MTGQAGSFAPRRHRRRSGRRGLWILGLVGGLTPFYLYPGLFLGAWPALLAGAGLVVGCLVAWWEPGPAVGAVGIGLAVASGLVLWFLGQVVIGFEAACLFGDCPPSAQARAAALKGVGVHVGSTLVPLAAWLTSRGPAGSWVWGMLTVLMLVWGVLGTLGVAGYLD